MLLHFMLFAATAAEIPRELFVTSRGIVVSKQDILAGTASGYQLDDAMESNGPAAILRGLGLMKSSTKELLYHPEFDKISAQQPSIPSYIQPGDMLVDGEWIRSGRILLPTEPRNSVVSSEEESEVGQVVTTFTYGAQSVTTQCQPTRGQTSVTFGITPINGGAQAIVNKDSASVGIQLSGMDNFVSYLGNKLISSVDIRKAEITINGQKYTYSIRTTGPFYRDDWKIKLKHISSGNKAEARIKRQYWERNEKTKRKVNEALNKAFKKLER